MELVGVGGSWWELVWVLGGEEIKEERWKNVDGDPWGMWCWFLVFLIIHLFELLWWVMRYGFLEIK